MKIFILAALISFGHGLLQTDYSNEAEQRIVGGVLTDIGKHGHQISIRKKSIFNPQNAYKHICGGCIYSENIALTAAHCIIATVPSQLKVVAGSNFKNASDGIIVPVKEIIMHENYNPDTYNNDVAILVLAIPLPLNKFSIRPVELINYAPLVGSLTTITGWGALSEGGSSPAHLQEVQVPVVGHDECNEDYEGSITEYMLCAGVRHQGGYMQIFGLCGHGFWNKLLKFHKNNQSIIVQTK